jgi:Cdc6-like AAA superfamily ATPase
VQQRQLIERARADSSGGEHMPVPGSWLGLVGRRSECDALLELVAGARAGRSQVLVLRGEPGIGKTALLDFLVDRATG